MTVLLVDDNEMIQMTRKLILERSGFSIVTAPDGATALSSLKRQTFSVAVVDYHLPDMDGDTLCRTMKAMRPGIRIILASGTIPENLSDCADYVVLKGGSPMEPINTVASLSKAA